ncbi:hypothetical protein KK137_09195 [Croceibacterium sp. LX-88]|uniref:Uncharacterized protein n=1 Tax=Croceibacterium selenioxidans TaxID=2838833 RepID=A0ABS5W422_9SPHN|nr:hypothetical protein [Croceibacterium selenioxidans]MBT2134507.1 hypothetical protein [Croceibacterium selenioxidans]
MPREGSAKDHCDGCTFTFDIRTAGDIHIHNYCAPPDRAPTPNGPGDGEDCLACAPQGTCLPPVAGAKHKLSRAQKLTIRAARSKVPSLLAASTMHAIRRYGAGYSPANPLEQRLFGKLDALPPALLRCMVDGLDQIPPGQRGTLVTDQAFADPAQPLDPGQLVIGLIEEIKQRAALTLFGDPAAVERPGKDRLYVPVGEDFFTQVRICRINQLRTANYIPSLQPQEYTPDEVQQSCQPIIVNGEPQVVCEVQTGNCPGNPVAGVCGRVLDISQGESLELEGVNYFDVNAKVRLIDKDTNTISRDVEAFIFGDADTPRDEIVNGETVLINDCRVHDKATFTVPNDLPPGIYQVQVVVPNSVNKPGFGAEIASNVEYINVLPPPTARYQIVVERIIARKETAPASWGSDEVGLRTIACAMNLSDEPLAMTKTPFKDVLDGVEFDSGTSRNVERIVFASDQPILALVLGVLGHEIDSESAYNAQINEWSDVFVDLVKEQWEFLLSLISAGGGLGVAIKAVGWKGVIAAAIVAVVVIAIDFIYSLWAPADLIIEDNIALSIIDLDRLTSAAAPIPPAATFTSNAGIKVNVNKTIPPEKIPFQYRETREYVSDEEESRYELTYRYNRIA